MLITANQPFGESGRIFPDQTMTLAAIDRLVHHATILEMNVESIDGARPSSESAYVADQRPMPRQRKAKSPTLIDAARRSVCGAAALQCARFERATPRR